MRYFQKAIRRAGIPVSFSQGYHPHQLLTFASPLGVGMESSGEYLDIEVEECSSIEELQEALEAQMAEGIDVLSARILPEHAVKRMDGEVKYEGRHIFKMNDTDLRKIRGHQISMIFQDPMTALNPVKRVNEQIAEGYIQHHNCS